MKTFVKQLVDNIDKFEYIKSDSLCDRPYLCSGKIKISGAAPACINLFINGEKMHLDKEERRELTEFRDMVYKRYVKFEQKKSK